MTPDDLPPLSPDVAALAHAFGAGVEQILGDAFASLYLYGALAFPRPARWLIDIDFHVLVRRPITGSERRDLIAHRVDLAASAELGNELDGYYLLLGDAASSSPPHDRLRPDLRDDAWALHRAHVLAGRFFLISGLDPRSVLLAPTWPQLEEALAHEMRFVEAHPEHQAFGILNACRILYSLRTRDVVVSKYAMATWSRAALPREWHSSVDAAVRFYSQAHTADDVRELARGWAPIVSYVRRAMDHQTPAGS